jgi:DNA-binding beta-propeller fold protein YncE
MSGPVALALAPDDRTLFVAAFDSNSVSVLARTPSSGAIRQVGCVSDQYEGETEDGCAEAEPLGEPSALTLSPDGRRLHVAVSRGVTVLDRDPTTGTLERRGCVTIAGFDDDEEEAADCLIGRGIAGASDLALSPDGRNLYVTSWYSDALAVFAPAASFASVKRGARGLMAVRVACPPLHLGACSGRLGAARAAPRVAATGSARFSVQPGFSTVVRLRLSRRSRDLLRRVERLELLVTATAERGRIGPIQRRVVLKGSVRRPPRAGPRPWPTG